MPGSPIPYVLNVWDQVKNKTTTVGGFLESGQSVSADMKVENDTLKIPRLLIDANFSSLAPPRNTQVLVNVSVTDNMGQPIENVNVILSVNSLKIPANNIGGGAYRTEFNTTGMSGLYNVTIYVTNPPMNYLPGISSYPLMVGTSDISVISSTALKGVLGLGYSVRANVTVTNNGDAVLPFAVAFYANSTLVSRQVLKGVESGASTIIPFVLGSSSLPKGNYTISAYAEPVLGEMNTIDNTLTCGNVIVAVVGDVDANGKVEIKDFALMAKSFGANYPDPRYVADYDIDDNGKVEIKDFAIAAKNYGKIDP